MNTVVDTVGMNDLVRALALNGANAISGMWKGPDFLAKVESPPLRLRNLILRHKGAHYIREILEKITNSFHFMPPVLGTKRQWI